MSFKILNALATTRAGRNINIESFALTFVFNTSVEIGSALIYSYCVKYLLTRVF